MKGADGEAREEQEDSDDDGDAGKLPCMEGGQSDAGKADSMDDADEEESGDSESSIWFLYGDMAPSRVVTNVRTTVRRKRMLRMEKLMSSCVASLEKRNDT